MTHVQESIIKQNFGKLYNTFWKKTLVQLHMTMSVRICLFNHMTRNTNRNDLIQWQIIQIKNTKKLPLIPESALFCLICNNTQLYYVCIIKKVFVTVIKQKKLTNLSSAYMYILCIILNDTTNTQSLGGRNSTIQ